MPRHLELVCAALERQSLAEFEVLVCDDGSGAETRRVVEGFASRFRGRVEHVWQEHQGFRKCRMLNEALRRARGDVFVFLDGDCVPHRDFMRDHLARQEAGRYLAGRRVELGPDLSARLSVEDVRAGYFDWPHPSLVLSVFRGDTEYLNRTVRVPWEPARRLLGLDRVADLKGCNYSVSREAMAAINGFDEAYEGYGREDTDVEVRLQNLGLKIKSLKGLALQYHVWHPRREFTPANEGLIARATATGRVRCEQGWQRG
jgi:glycosyltransferase involved in cell wall biosynthesis